MRYIIFNKPFGVLSQFTTEGTAHQTLKDFIEAPNVYAAGRLDLDSEGLLLLTDDGQLIAKLARHEAGLEKCYYVLVERQMTDDGSQLNAQVEKMRSGLKLRDYITLPAFVQQIAGPDLPPRPKPVTPHGPTTWLDVRLREGKKRQIRHMTAAVNLFTLRIFRYAIGPIQIGDLPPGKWRDLRDDELRALG